MSDPKHRHHPRQLASIVEEQVARSSSYPPPPTIEPAAGHWPVVAISRQFATKGTELGERVARRLGFRCWDRAIVTTIAENLRIEEGSILELDEHSRNAVEDLLATTLFGEPARSSDYRDELRQLVTTLERRGSAVIVGRGAHCIVDPASALRVRLVCPLHRRIAEYAARMEIDEHDARRAVRTGDKDLAEFVRRTFDVDLGDPTNYDLVINTSVFGPERADTLVLAAYMAKFGHLPAAVRAAS